MHYAKQYDLFGEHAVRVLEGNKIERIEDGTGDLPDIDGVFAVALREMWSAVNNFSKNSKRTVPLTEKELEGSLGAKLVRRLIKKKLLTKVVLPLVDQRGKSIGHRACVPFTEEGRRHCRRICGEEISRDLPGQASVSSGSVTGDSEGVVSAPAGETNGAVETGSSPIGRTEPNDQPTVPA